MFKLFIESRVYFLNYSENLSRADISLKRIVKPVTNCFPTKVLSCIFFKMVTFRANALQAGCSFCAPNKTSSRNDSATTKLVPTTGNFVPIAVLLIR